MSLVVVWFGSAGWLGGFARQRRGEQISLARLGFRLITVNLAPPPSLPRTHPEKETQARRPEQYRHRSEKAEAVAHASSAGRVSQS